MRLSLFISAFVCWIGLQGASVFAQSGAEPGDPMRIAILVDNSTTLSDPLMFIRRGLQQFVNALPPNHELMLVTTGAQMNIRVEPTRDYLKIIQSANSINVMRQAGNALLASVGEVHERFLRNVERRFPVLVIVANDGPDLSPELTNERANAVLSGLKKSGVRVNAVLINPTGSTGITGSRQIRSFTLEMIDRTQGAFETASAPTVPAKLKTLAGRIAEQYILLSPTKMPTAEFRK